MARAAARSSPSNRMLEKGRGLIADLFFFIAEILPAKLRGGKSREFGPSVVSDLRLTARLRVDELLPVTQGFNQVDQPCQPTTTRMDAQSPTRLIHFVD